MASTLADLEAAVSAVQQTSTTLGTDVNALIARGGINLDPVVQALANVNTALVALDDAVKASLG